MLQSKTFEVELVSEGFNTSKCGLGQGHIQCTVTYQVDKKVKRFPVGTDFKDLV